jgi:hypothetical protein
VDEVVIAPQARGSTVSCRVAGTGAVAPVWAYYPFRFVKTLINKYVV